MAQSDKSVQRDWPIRDECGEDEFWTGGTHLLGLGLLGSGKEGVGDGALQLIALLGFLLRRTGKEVGRTWNARRMRKTRS